MRLPERIVCLSAETAETLYELGEEDRIVAISGYTSRPARARKEKVKIGAFSSADLDGIAALSPDLILTFSDVQAELAAELIRRGFEVHAFNQRSIDDILRTIGTIGALVGAPHRAAELIATLETRMEDAKSAAAAHHCRPRIFFEEWNEPIVSGIRWVSEIIGIAGGLDVFADRALRPAAASRVVSEADIITARPDIILGSWCGKKFRANEVAARAGFGAIPAVRDSELYEIDSSLILQPGPGAITLGLPAIQRIIARWCETRRSAPHGP